MENLKASKVVLSYKNEVKREDRVKITMAENAYKLMVEDAYNENTIEHHISVKAILLNVRSEVLGILNVAEGGINESPIDIRVVFQAALLSNASAIILVRNSPSGSITPGLEDKSSSSRFKEACRALGFTYHDYLIISSDRYFSFSNEGLI